MNNNSININDTIYKQQIGKQFNYSWNWDLLDAVAEIVENVIDDINGGSEDIEEAIYEEIDRVAHATRIKWTIMEYYQSPEKANYDTARDDLYLDISEIIQAIQKGE